MQPYTAGIKPQSTSILSPPPRSGSLSVYAKKNTALAFFWLSALVVWGNVANTAGAIGFSEKTKCTAKCIFMISFALICWVIATILLFLNYLAEQRTISRTGCFSHAMEAQITASLVVWWILVVGPASTEFETTPMATQWFAWLGFFASIYATLKAYHSFKEEDLPSDLPEGYNEEDHVYG